MNQTKKDLGKNTYQFDIVVPKAEVAAKYDLAFGLLAKELTVEGFRKGNVPKKIAEKHLTKDEIYKKAINELIPVLYKEILDKEKVKPIISPKIELIKAEDGKDWEIRITIAEKPNIELKNYKKIVQDITAKEKKEDIWVPGQSGEKKEKPDEEAAKRTLLNKVLDAILNNVKVEIPDLLIEDELNKRLAQLVDDVRKAGLTLENYLRSKNETIDSIKAKYRKEIEEIYKLEFALDEISDDAKITVGQEDLDKVFATIADEKAREEAKKNSYFYASVLKRQKTLDFLVSL